MNREDGEAVSGLLLGAGGNRVNVSRYFPDDLPFKVDQLLEAEIWEKIIRYSRGQPKTETESSGGSSSSLTRHTPLYSELGTPSRFEDVNRLTLDLANNLGTSYLGIVDKKIKITIKHVLRIEPLFTDGSMLDEHLRCIMSLSHPNILPLLAFSYTADDLLLIYEFLPNGNLDSRVRLCANESEHLDWNSRIGVALEVSRALSEIHDSVLAVHGRVKLSNVLSGENGHVQLSDFGVSQRRQENPPLQKDDVKDFGMLMLELIMGGNPYDIIENGQPHGEDMEEQIAMVITNALVDNNLENVLNHGLHYDYDPDQMVEMLNICVSCIGMEIARPSMLEIMHSLENSIC